MFILRITLILIGLAFIGFGYAIWFKEKYHLINNFENDKKNGRLSDSFAKRVGMIELIGGITCFTLGLISIFLNDVFTLIFFIFCIVSIITALIFNQVKSAKQK
ncbi:hypothetical protein SAMN05660297_02403 [Natronincola peptidivorans]|uniref:DUF3784 domain-containing protein n=1 Tax=Natronincola peptidivorans TaxID=426128 RepID=A0A1I0EE34_9FIRM|nr:DUF3784 domain-containing protein [Natronincola peptidivorans]SET43314.1 hypothetical protein SAMN05660297_02403 [Natronincola peptidivorans]